MPDIPFYEKELSKLLGVIPDEDSLEPFLDPDIEPDTFEEEDDHEVVESGVPEEPTQSQGNMTRAPVSLKNIFTHHDAHPIVLDVLMLKEYGPQWLIWEPETVWDVIQKDFKQNVSNNNAAKIQAVRTCHLVETPWKVWEGFNPVCQALNNNIPDFRTLQKPSPAQVTYAVTLMGIFKKESFSLEVEKYIAACFLDDGIYFLPEPVSFAQDEASQLRYRCTKCGRIDVDEDNFMCDSCGAPISDLKKKPTYDHEPVKERYKQILKQGENHDVLQETEIDIQVSKLLVVKNYITFRNSQLKEQSRLVK